MSIAEYLAEQKRLAAAATEGPWEVDLLEPGIWCPQHIVIGNYTASDMFESPAWEDGKPEDLSFIAAARESVPRMVAALEAVVALCDTAERVQNAPLAPRTHSGDPFPARVATGDVIRALETTLGGES